MKMTKRELKSMIKGLVEEAFERSSGGVDMSKLLEEFSEEKAKQIADWLKDEAGDDEVDMYSLPSVIFAHWEYITGMNEDEKFDGEGWPDTVKAVVDSAGLDISDLHHPWRDFPEK